MDYQKIHDSIIRRSEHRVYKPDVHYWHHVLPIHEDPNSTYVVPLTLKEHYVVHHLRWKITGTTGNKMAYSFMKGIFRGDCNRQMTVEGGKKGGKQTRENKSGIFSDSWDRSAEAKRRWRDGVINASHFNGYEHCSRAGKQTRENKSGIFSDSWDRSADMKRQWKDGERDGAVYAEIGRQISLKATWTNGTINIKSDKYPGEGWILGQTSKATGLVHKYKQYLGKTFEQFVKEYDSEQ